MNTLKEVSGTSPFKIMLSIIFLLWIILIISFFIPGLKNFGILPRSPGSLPGILFAPFLHLNFSHLIANSISLLILGTILLSFEEKRSIFILLNIIIWGGLGTWLIGRGGAVHIGASGVVYGIMGYLFSTGIFRRSLKTIVISALVFFLYGGAVWGILPGQTGISWESHLCGFAVGILLAKIYSKIPEKSESEMLE